VTTVTAQSGPARSRGPAPTVVLQDEALLGGHRARRAEHLGVPVPQGGAPGNDSAIVPAPVPERTLALVTDPPVELDPGGELVVVDVDPDHPVAGDPALADAGR
jgi:hypothetical protein